MTQPRLVEAAQNALAVLVVGLLAWLVLATQDEPAESPYRSLDPAVPTRLHIPSLGVTAPVVPIALGDTGVLDPPRDATRVGWWDGSAEPGRAGGQSVITGHSVHTGGGSMDRIGELRPGRYVDVTTRSGRMRYRVDRVAVFSRADVARQATRLFGQGAGTDGRLVLVSCTDWDGSAYANNVIVFATPLGEPRERTVEAEARR